MWLDRPFFLNETFEIRKNGTCEEDTLVKTRKRDISPWTNAIHKFNNDDAPAFKEPKSLEERFPAAYALYEDKAFIVWMCHSAFSDFDKLYRIIEEPLMPSKNAVPPLICSLPPFCPVPPTRSVGPRRVNVPQLSHPVRCGL